MTTDEREREVAGRRSTERSSTKVLTALSGFCDPEAPCIEGELLRTRHWCGRAGCSCGTEFFGTGSHGVAVAGRVTSLEVPRATVLRTIGSVVDTDEGGHAVALAAADRLLRAVEGWEIGRLVRRESGRLVAFPASARITDRHTISYPVDES